MISQDKIRSLWMQLYMMVESQKHVENNSFPSEFLEESIKDLEIMVTSEEHGAAFVIDMKKATSDNMEILKLIPKDQLVDAAGKLYSNVLPKPND